MNSVFVPLSQWLKDVRIRCLDFICLEPFFLIQRKIWYGIVPARVALNNFVISRDGQISVKF